jgi:hypothetical protein
MGQIAFLTAIVLALIPAAASAAGTNCQAPAGTSGIDQYCEVLPGAGGSGSSGHHKKKAASPVSPKTTRDLEHQGTAGAAILALTQSGGAPAATQTPPPAAKTKTHKRHKAAATTPSNSQTPPSAPKPSVAGPKGPAPGNDPFSAVGNSVSVGSAMSAGFVWVLVGIALILGAMTWLSYRTRRHETS